MGRAGRGTGRSAGRAVVGDGGFLQAGIEDYSAKATEFRGMRSLGDLWQFAGLAYAPIRLQVTRLGQERDPSCCRT